MPKPYSKPLAGGGSRIVYRDEGGRFHQAGSLGCKVCEGCGQIMPPRLVNVGSEEFPFMRNEFDEKCPSCGKPVPPQ